MSKKQQHKTEISQLSLWQEKPTPPSPEYIPVPAMGETMEWPQRWADGDSRPEQLERLARVVKGDLETFTATNGMKIWFRVIDTRVEGDHVIMTLRRIEPVLKGYNDWLREQGQQVPGDESDE